MNKVGKYLGIDDLFAEIEADKIAAQRDNDLEEGKVQPMTHEEVFGKLRSSS
ncbi:MAG: hypothetical protein O2960_18760 [Verrucomicrobia bacterium]|nr:hypothetical protein [Verrucomicrobiota bacterium]